MARSRRRTGSPLDSRKLRSTRAHGGRWTLASPPHRPKLDQARRNRVRRVSHFVARCTGCRPEDAFLMICLITAGPRCASPMRHCTRACAGQSSSSRATAFLHAIRRPIPRCAARASPPPRASAVSGLNPHAGEGGSSRRGAADHRPGDRRREENDVAAEGPFGADTCS